MPTIVKQKKRDYSKTNINARIKEALKKLIIKDNYSVFDAASKYDMDELHAENILYSKKPSKQQISHAFEIYDKGFPLIMACVSSGVSPQTFKTAKRDKSKNKYRPERW